MSRVEAFELQGILGEGGMGRVFRARHVRSGTDVAFKVLQDHASRASLENFEREVQAHAGLTHPGVVALYDYGVVAPGMFEDGERGPQPGERYVVMEIADQGDLTGWMPLSHWNHLREVLQQVLRTLAFTHARHVIHRDLKPENILVFSGLHQPRFKLADFGIAHAATREVSDATALLEGLTGTPYYMSPEQTRGQWYNYGPWTDLYALGCIAFELVSGRPPFDAVNVMDLLWMQQTSERPEPTPRFDVPRELRTWIARAMAIDHQQRFQSAAEALHALPDAFDVQVPWEQVDETDVYVSPGTRAEDREDVASQRTLLLDPEDLEVEDDVFDDWDEAALMMTRLDASQERSDTSWTWRVGASWRGVEDERRLPVGLGLGLVGLREVPMVGRAGERDRVWSTLERVFVSHRSEVVWITGPAGVGKSRLMEWMGQRVHEVGAARVLRVTYSAGVQGRADGLMGMLETFFHSWKLSGDRLRAHLGQMIPRAGSSDRFYERDLGALVDVMRTSEDASGSSHYVSERQMFGLLERMLGRLALTCPVVVTIDDAQWGPEALRWLEYMTTVAGPMLSVVFLCTAREDLGERLEPQVLASLERLGARASSAPTERTTRVPLEVLPREDVRALISRLIELEPAAVDTLVGWAEGNPMFAVHMLEHVIDSDDLVVTPGGYALERVEVPRGVAELWERRLEVALSVYPPATRPAAYAALELAATLGRRVDAAEWSAVCRHARIDAPSTLPDELVGRRLMARAPKGWTFTHALLRAVLERRAGRDGELVRHHRRCARGLEELYGAQDWVSARRRAAHLSGAGEYAEAGELLLFACDALQMRGRLGAYAEAMADHDATVEARGLPPAHPDALSGRIHHQFIAIQRGQFDAAADTLESCYELALESDRSDLTARAALYLGTIHHRRGDTKGAGVWDLRAYTHGVRGATYPIAARALRSVTDFGFTQERALEVIAQTLEHVEGYDRIELLQTRVNALIVYERKDEARAQLEVVIRESEASGFRPILLHASNAMGDLTRYAGRLDEARHHYVHAQKVAREMQVLQVIPIIGLNLVQVCLAQRRLETGADLLARIEEALDRHGISGARRGLVLTLRFALAAGMGDAEALADVQRAIGARWGKERRLVNDHPHVLELAASLALERDDRATARRALTLAHEMWWSLDIPDAVARVEASLRDI